MFLKDNEIRNFILKSVILAFGVGCIGMYFLVKPGYTKIPELKTKLINSQWECIDIKLPNVHNTTDTLNLPLGKFRDRLCYTTVTIDGCLTRIIISSQGISTEVIGSCIPTSAITQ